jgi:peptidoglycan/xylan/chitin deacetylase (PgdA/CDA1 family)
VALVVPIVLCAGAVLTLKDVDGATTPRMPVVNRVSVPQLARANAAARLDTTASAARPSGQPRRAGSPMQVTKRVVPTVPARRQSKVVYLTFDDGPSRYTGRILAVLRRTGSTATFFQLGVNRSGRAAQIRAIPRQGSNIGNHTYNHPALTKLSPGAVRWQLAHGPRAKCFRPPYGATNPAVRRAARAAGMRQILWTVDPQDWSRPGTAALARVGASRAIRNHSIILLHDGGGDRTQTVTALPKLIAKLHARGFLVRALPYCG